MLRTPARRNRSRNQIGDARVLSTSTMIRAWKRGHAAALPREMTGCSIEVAATAVVSGGTIGWEAKAATSRAMPRIDIASPRLGVTASSNTVSSRPRYSRTFAPTGASGGNSTMPSEMSLKPNSLAEHNMPADSTPRNLAALILRSPGRCAPTVASAVFKPARALGAPQTICNGAPPSPRLTSQTRSLSACGCGWALTISATRTPSNGGAAAAIDSNSKPAIVSALPSALGSSPASTHSRSHCSEIFMRHRTGARSANHSRRIGAGHSRHRATSRGARFPCRRHSPSSARHRRRPL